MQGKIWPFKFFVIDFPSALSAVWETNQSSESAVHCPGTSWGWRIFQNRSQAVLQLRVVITVPAHTRSILASASDETIHLLPCYEQRCCCDRCLRSRGSENVRERAPEEKSALSSELLLWLPLKGKTNVKKPKQNQKKTPKQTQTNKKPKPKNNIHAQKTHTCKYNALVQQ